MIYLLFILLFFVLIFGPQLWVKYILDKYQYEKNELPGTGGELAKHLAERFQLPITISIKESDHYDPSSKTVGLQESNFGGKSLTAMAIAAHEIGHAIQDIRQEPRFIIRNHLLKLTLLLEKAGVVAIIAVPLLAGFIKSPTFSALLFIFGFSQLILSSFIHLATLPVEWDASFNKALPLLLKGEYITSQEEPIIRVILKAAALTYFSAALAGVFNFWRWIDILRR